MGHECSGDEEEAHNCCGSVHHRFHSHARVHQTKADKIKLLNFSRKISQIGLPDMEFSLTPVPGDLKKMRNIYQTTKLVTNPEYVA